MYLERVRYYNQFMNQESLNSEHSNLIILAAGFMKLQQDLQPTILKHY